MNGTFDIIIVNYNTRDELSQCLASIHAHPPDTLREIVVVDNASGDGSTDLVRARFPGVRVIGLSRNVGFAAANNVGIRETRAPLVLLLNSDTVVPQGSLDRLVQRLIETDATAAGPRLVDAEGRPEVSFGPMLSPLAELRQRTRVRLAGRRGALARAYVERLLADEREVDWVSGACLLVRREPAVAAGLLDERYFMYEEDVDFCAAVRARGGRILFVPAVEVQHLRGRSIRRAHTHGATHYDRSHLAFYEKHLPRWAPWLRAWLRLRGRRIR
jgi:GT2 family glycosyltransferase